MPKQKRSDSAGYASEASKNHTGVNLGEQRTKFGDTKELLKNSGSEATTEAKMTVD
jgi:hypothetical protein